MKATILINVRAKSGFDTFIKYFLVANHLNIK